MEKSNLETLKRTKKKIVYNIIEEQHDMFGRSEEVGTCPQVEINLVS